MTATTKVILTFNLPDDEKLWANFEKTKDADWYVSVNMPSAVTYVREKSMIVGANSVEIGKDV